jgi:hypothetical protein
MEEVNSRRESRPLERFAPRRRPGAANSRPPKMAILDFGGIGEQRECRPEGVLAEGSSLAANILFARLRGTRGFSIAMPARIAAGSFNEQHRFIGEEFNADTEFSYLRWCSAWRTARPNYTVDTSGSSVTRP